MVTEEFLKAYNPGGRAFNELARKQAVSIATRMAKDKYKSDSWKMSLHPSFNMVSAGQLNNNKPFKAITLTAMKIYWLKEFLKAKNNDKLSDRNRAFWWFLFLYFYSIVDAAVDIEMQTFPENNIQNKEVE